MTENLCYFFSAQRLELGRLADSIGEKIEYLRIHHNWRLEHDDKALMIISQHEEHMRLVLTKLSWMYLQTLHFTRLGDMTPDNEEIFHTKDRQLYLLYKDGIIFEDFNEYDRLLREFED